MRDEPTPDKQIADVRDQIARQRQYAGPLLAPVWEVLARLTALLAALWRRLPPEP